MTEFFLQLVSLGKIIGIMILTVIVLRFFMKKAPKKMMKPLWLIVGIRACLPFSIRSSLGILPADSAPIAITAQGVVQAAPSAKAFTPGLQTASVGAAPAAFPVQRVLACIWVVGMVCFALYLLISYLKTKRLVKDAQHIGGNVYASSRIPSPFIAGLFSPKIYVLPGMSQAQQELILAHENCHLKHKDHIFKFLAFLLLGVYWFNPLMWLAYYLFCKDIELACDEEVIESLSFRQRKDYAFALLDSTHVAGTSVYGVAFCENNVKERIVNVMNYKKPKFWIIIAAVVCAAAVLVIFFTVKDSAKPDLVTYEFETFDGRTVKIDASNIVSQKPETGVLETKHVPENAEIIAPGRDYVYLEDAQYYYVEDAANGLLTVASKSTADGNARQYTGDRYGFAYDPGKFTLFEDPENAAVTLSFTQEGVDMAGSNVVTFTVVSGSAEDVLREKVSAVSGDASAISDATIGDAKAYVYSQSGESADSGLKTVQTYYAVQGKDGVVFVDFFRTIGPDTETEAAIYTEFASVLQSLTCK